jgi:hypothetical protein
MFKRQKNGQPQKNDPNQIKRAISLSGTVPTSPHLPAQLLAGGFEDAGCVKGTFLPTSGSYNRRGRLNGRGDQFVVPERRLIGVCAACVAMGATP